MKWCGCQGCVKKQIASKTGSEIPLALVDAFLTFARQDVLPIHMPHRRFLEDGRIELSIRTHKGQFHVVFSRILSKQSENFGASEIIKLHQGDDG